MLENPEKLLFKRIFPYSEMIELGAGDALSSRAIAELPSFTGKGMEDVFQKFILQHSGYAISEIGNVEFPDPESRRNEELDLAVVADDGVMLFGECKWRTEPVGVPIYEELVRRSVIAYPTAGKRVYYLLSRSGFTDELRNISAMSNGHVILIEGRDLIAAR